MRTKTVVALIAILTLIVLLVPAKSALAPAAATPERVNIAHSAASVERSTVQKARIASQIRADRSKAREAAKAKRIAAAKQKASEERKAEARAAAAAKPKPKVQYKSKPKVSSGGTPITIGGRPTGVWLKLAQCESGANLTRNSGNGYYGAYQFSPTTWQGFTGGRFGPVLKNGWAVQTFVAYRIWLKQGWGAFPGCGRKLGHPNLPAVASPR